MFLSSQKNFRRGDRIKTLRDQLLDTARNEKRFDLIVVGGGATGLYTALDGTSRGFKTLLLEKSDFASGTSSKSTKLFHGGLRYLKQGHFGLVREALKERFYLTQNAPHLVQAKPFLIPFYKQFERIFYGAGVQAYDFLAGPFMGTRHAFLSKEEVIFHFPSITKKGLKGGVLYYDGQFDDARFAIELVKTIIDYGGTPVNYVSVESFLKEKNQIVGVSCFDSVSGHFFNAYGKAIINAGGIFVDEISMLDNRSHQPTLALSRGTHITIGKEFFQGERALLVPKTKDKRVIFVIPWLNKVIIGTTDVKTIKPLEEPAPTEIEIDFLLDEIKPYLESSPTSKDILSAFAGIRPLVKSHPSKATSSLMRKHKISISPSGLITISGGKWTIARKMGEDAINAAIRVGFLDPIVGKTKKLSLHQTDSFLTGTPIHPSLPYCEGDFIRAIDQELVVTLSDLLARRTRSLFLDANATISIAPKIATLMAKKLGYLPSWEKKACESFSLYAKKYCV